jgi:nitroimidazol reductase NimA-like FMN-containing flavoprotein (pyridoxamine 5'-phosphate oxidase superfamily)
MQQQRRGRVIAMNGEELTSFLGEQHTCRLATTGPDGPHVAPVWFVWDGQALWVYSLTRSQRWANVTRDPRVAVVIDDGPPLRTSCAASRSRARPPSSAPSPAPASRTRPPPS